MKKPVDLSNVLFDRLDLKIRSNIRIHLERRVEYCVFKRLHTPFQSIIGHKLSGTLADTLGLLRMRIEK